MENKAMVVMYPVAPGKEQEVLAALQAAAIQVVDTQKAKFGEVAKSENLTPLQKEILSALTYRPLNRAQIGVLEAHLKHFRNNVGSLSTLDVAEYLYENGFVEGKSPGEKMAQAQRSTEAVFRSIGKRLKNHLKSLPTRFSKDRMGEDVADEVPLLAMFKIVKDNSQTTYHRLVDVAELPVALALGAAMSGAAASSALGPGEDPNELIVMAMSRRAAAMIERVARTSGVSRDAAIMAMAASAGAG